MAGIGRLADVLALVFVLFMIGCVTVPCTTDADCGAATCSDNLRSVTTSSCVDGACAQSTVECNETEACLQGSDGARCALKTEFPLPWMSCNSNSQVLTVTGTNPFSALGFQCSADCPKDYTCNMGTCLCEENKKKPQPPNPCPAPVFTHHYFDPPKIDYTFDELADIYIADPDGIRSLGEGIIAMKTINVPAYQHERDGLFYIIPFPHVQLEVHPADDPMETPGGYCANDYFVGAKALTMDLQWLTSPTGEYDYCSWGGESSFMGVVTVCPDDMADWFDEITRDGMAGGFPF